MRLTEKKLRIFAWRFFALQVVTPFTPFVLSDAYFSPEIEKYGLQKLNPKSINLAKTRKMPSLKNPVIFVQVDQLATFCSTILGDIFQPFTLITGKWHLPPLQEDGYTQEILENPFLTEWYSQNQVYSNLPILPFPYGVELTSAPHIWWRMRLRGIFGLGRSGVFVPHVRIHRHLAGSALQTRQELHSLASPSHPIWARFSGIDSLSRPRGSLGYIQTLGMRSTRSGSCEQSSPHLFRAFWRRHDFCR